MNSDAKQIANAFKAAGEALLKLGQLFETHPSPKRKRVAKDKNAPKKNITSYFHYCEEARPRIAKQHPTLTLPELSKLLGDQWRSLPEEDKKPYQEAANKDKIRYEKEMATYHSTDTNNLSDAVKKKAKSTPIKPTTDATLALEPVPESSGTTELASDETTGTAEMTYDEHLSNAAIAGEKRKEKKKKNKKNKKAHKSKH